MFVTPNMSNKTCMSRTGDNRWWTCQLLRHSNKSYQWTLATKGSCYREVNNLVISFIDESKLKPG